MMPSEAIGATSVDAAIAVRRPALVQIERWVARVVGAFAAAALLAEICYPAHRRHRAFRVQSPVGVE